MKINDLKSKINEYEVRMKAISETADMTDELRQEFDGLVAKRDSARADLKRAEAAEAINLQEAAREVEEPVAERNILSDLQSYFRTGVVPEEFRGQNGGFMLRGVLKTTTDSGIINKTVEDSLSIAKSPAEMVLSDLGVTRYADLNGQFVCPSMPQLSASFKTETTALADASGTPASLTLTPRRLGAYNIVTKETLASTNPSIWNGIVQDLKDAWYRAVLADLCDQIQTDAIDASTTIAGATLAYADLVQLQANVPYEMAKPAYLTTPATAAFLKKTATIASVAGPIWEGPVMKGTVDGLPAFASALANTDTLIYADFAQAVVAEFGNGIEVIVNPYTYDLEGELKVSVFGLVDTGFKNKNFASWIADVSIS